MGLIQNDNSLKVRDAVQLKIILGAPNATDSDLNKLLIDFEDALTEIIETQFSGRCYFIFGEGKLKSMNQNEVNYCVKELTNKNKELTKVNQNTIQKTMRCLKSIKREPKFEVGECVLHKSCDYSSTLDEAVILSIIKGMFGVKYIAQFKYSMKEVNEKDLRKLHKK